MMLRRPSMHASPAPPSGRRGLTLIELMLSLSITVMVTGAMSGMMSAVSAGVMDRQDSRTNMIRSHAAETKLSAYVSSSRVVWEISDTSVALWYADSRQSDSIHATEVRWIVYDAVRRTVEVHFLKFPDEWTQTARELNDTEYQKTIPASSVYSKYATTGYMASLRLLDNVEDFSVSLDTIAPLDAQRVTFTLTMAADNEPLIVTVPTTIAHHQPPTR